MASTASPQPSRIRRTTASAYFEDNNDRRVGISNVKYRVGAPPLRPLPLETYPEEPFAKVEPPFSNPRVVVDDLVAIAHEILAWRGILDPWEGEEESMSRLLKPTPNPDLFDTDYEYDPDDDPDDYRVRVVTRKVHEHRDVGETTLFIIAPWEDGSSEAWEAAVVEIRRAVDSYMRVAGRPEFEMPVEMIAAELLANKRIDVITEQPLLNAAWPKLGRDVFDLLESFPATRSRMTNMSLLRLGYERDFAPGPVTVYISVDYDSDESAWAPVVAAIERYLRESGWPEINVHMEHNEALQPRFVPKPARLPADFPRKPLRPLSSYHHVPPLREHKRRVGLGAGISASAYLHRTGDNEKKCYHSPEGTLGCYVQVKTATAPEWKTVVLTSYRAVRPCFEGFVLEQSPVSPRTVVAAPPTPNSALELLDRDGRAPNDAAEDGNVMESPSRLRHDEDIRDLEGLVASIGYTPSQIELTAKQKFFDAGHQVLGKVWSSSGYARRTSGGSRLDWALVEVSPDRVAPNALPSFQDWGCIEGSRPPKPYTMSATLKPPGEDTSLKRTPDAACTKVYRVGADARASDGFHAGFQSAVRFRDDVYMFAGRSAEEGPDRHMTWEHAYVQCGGAGAGANMGDTGAVVFDKEGAVVGLQVASHYPQRVTRALTYVTPIEDVLEDIKRLSDGNVTDIRFP